MTAPSDAKVEALADAMRLSAFGLGDAIDWQAWCTCARALIAAMAMPDGDDDLTEDGGGWRPIESAPGDGTIIWIGGPGWTAQARSLGNDQGWNKGYGWDRDRGPFHPTHWQPLYMPEPPK